jgi:hypothetical protein
MLTQMKNTGVYRVCAGSVNRWQVFKDTNTEPVASFGDKAAALNYAMCLARGRIAWHLLLRAGSDASGNAIAAIAGARH